MNGAASITEVGLYGTHDAFSEGDFYNAEILLCNTTAGELSTSFEDNYTGFTPVRVWSADTLSIDWTAPGWNGQVFDTPFEYDGTHNLIIEYRYLGENGRTINTGAFYPPTPNRTLDAGLPTSSTGRLLGFMTSLRIHYIPAIGIGDDEPVAGPALTVEESPSSAPLLGLSVPESGIAGLGLYSLDGRLVREWSGWCEGGVVTTVRCPGGELPAGVYLVLMEAGGASASARIAILH